MFALYCTSSSGSFQRIATNFYPILFYFTLINKLRKNTFKIGKKVEAEERQMFSNLLNAIQHIFN